MAQKFPFLLPVGRFMFGSLYKANDKDFDGNPLVFKSGADKGKPRLEFVVGVAIPKDGTNQHWAVTAWGAEIWKAGHSGVANAGQMGDDFSWKVTDGDSAVVPKARPNKTAPKAPREKEGYPGHWVLNLKSSYAPKIVDGTDGSFRPMLQPDAVMPGDWIQVQGDAQYNSSESNAGVFLNHSIVCFSGLHKDGRLSGGGEDPAAVGFSVGLAAGAVTAPVGTFPGAAAPAPGTPPVPPAAVAAPVPPAAAVTPPIPPVAVAPNPAFAPPPPVPAAPAAPVRTMLPKANGVPYEEYIKAGWTDAQLIADQRMAG